MGDIELTHHPLDHAALLQAMMVPISQSRRERNSLMYEEQIIPATSNEESSTALEC